MRNEPMKVTIAREAQNDKLLSQDTREYYMGLFDGYSGGLVLSMFTGSESYQSGWNEGYELNVQEDDEEEEPVLETVFMRPYDLGFHNFCSHVEREDNPFLNPGETWQTSDSSKAHAWDAGWCEAFSEELLLLQVIGQSWYRERARITSVD